MTIITLPIGASLDTLKRRICEQVPDIEITVLDLAIDAAGLLLALLKARPDVTIAWA